MMFKNTIRLTFVNFINTWKILLYKIITILSVLGLTMTIGLPIIKTLIIEDFFVQAKAQYEALFFNGNISALFLTTSNVVKDFFVIITNHSQVALFVLVVVVAIITYYFLSGLQDLSVSNIIGGYMSNCVKYGYLNTYVANLRNSFFLQLFRIVFVLPLNVLLIFLAYIIFDAILPVSSLLATLVCILFIIVAFALKNTLFSGWVPAIQVKDLRTWQGFKAGIKAVSRRFYRTLSTNISLNLCLIVINLIALIFTCGVGLLVTLPLSVLIMLISNMTMYYGSNGLRYYIDNQVIITPKKLELQDTFKKVKNMI